MRAGGKPPRPRNLSPRPQVTNPTRVQPLNAALEGPHRGPSFRPAHRFIPGQPELLSRRCARRSRTLPGNLSAGRASMGAGQHWRGHDPGRHRRLADPRPRRSVDRPHSQQTRGGCHCCAAGDGQLPDAALRQLIWLGGVDPGCQRRSCVCLCPGNFRHFAGHHRAPRLHPAYRAQRDLQPRR